MANINNLIKPKWQLHDLNNNPEHDLYTSYVVEFTDIQGIECWYWVRDEDRIEIDNIYGEPRHQNILYRDPKLTKLIYDVTEEPTLTGGFGIVSEDIVQYGFMPKFTYSRDVSGTGTPKPGDVIQTIWNDRSYEVVDVGEEAHIFQLKKLIYEFILRPYRFSEQSDDAGQIGNSVDRSNRTATFLSDPSPSGGLFDGSITTSTPLSGFGNNKEIEEESDDIDLYGDVDTSIYGY